MGKAAKRSSQIFPAPQEQEVIEANNFHQQSSWIMTDKNGGSSSFDSTKEDSGSSECSFSSSSSDFVEDASSFTSSSSSSNGPLYHLSDLMAQLPIKRGLSKYYQGKCQSFASLASVESLEDLAKRENPYKKRIKLCKSFDGGFDSQRFCSPKATISKKVSSRGSRSSTTRNCNNNFLVSCRTSAVPVQKHF